MKAKISLFALALVTGCQSAPTVQAPLLLLQDKPMIVVRHNGGTHEGACPMWVKVNGEYKGEVILGNSISIDVNKGIHTVSLGISANGMYGVATSCFGNLQTPARVTRAVEVSNRPVKLAYELQGTGKRWIPFAGIFLPPTPVLVPDNGS